MYGSTAVEELTRGDRVAELYRRLIRDAIECTGFVVDSEGLLNRPVRYADEFNALTKREHRSPVIAMVTGIVAAVLFPTPAELMSQVQLDARNAYLKRYLPRDRALQAISMQTFAGVRTDLMSLMTGMQPVIEKSGVPRFLPSKEPYVALAQCDLALLYHMAYGCGGHDDVKAMYRFVHLMLKQDDGQPARVFSPQVLDQFVSVHMLQYIQGEGVRTALMAPVTHIDLAYRLYLEGALDRYFGSMLSEKQFCEKVGQCTVRGPGKPSMPILQPATPITSKARDGKVFGDTRADLYLADAVLGDR